MPNSYRCGNSSETFTPSKPEQADEAPSRGHTPLHFSPVAPPAGFRVVADLRKGGVALLCLGHGRGEALASARRIYREVIGEVASPTSAAFRQLDGLITHLRLQRWEIGERGAGRWVDLPTRRGELPRVRID